MSQYTRDFVRSFIAGADLSTKQYFLVKLGVGTNDIILANAATDRIVGVLQEKPKLNQVGQVAMLGTSKVVAGGTILKGDCITSNANGQAVATTVAGNTVIGIALEAAVSGDIFEILLVNFKY